MSYPSVEVTVLKVQRPGEYPEVFVISSSDASTCLTYKPSDFRDINEVLTVFAHSSNSTILYATNQFVLNQDLRIEKSAYYLPSTSTMTVSIETKIIDWE